MTPTGARTLPFKLSLCPTPPAGADRLLHGLGGTRDGRRPGWRTGPATASPALAVQHPGSDAGCSATARPGLRRALKAAMNPEELAPAPTTSASSWAPRPDPQLPDAIHGPAIGLAATPSAPSRCSCWPANAARPSTSAPDRAGAGWPQPLGPPARRSAGSPSALRPICCFMGLTGSRDDGMGLSDISAANRELPYRRTPAGIGRARTCSSSAAANPPGFAGQASDAEGLMFPSAANRRLSSKPTARLAPPSGRPPGLRRPPAATSSPTSPAACGPPTRFEFK